jgi:hypothetical protein
VLQYIPQYIVNNQPTTGIGSITEVVECVWRINQKSIMKKDQDLK